ncbi:MAG: DNA polymerase III subunit delta, partial [bacterium]|nr:DNA polymerase III subunit delta [bacterium]
AQPANWESIIDEARSSNFFIESRKIIVVTVREEKKITLLKHDKALLKEYLAKPNPNTILIVYFSIEKSKDDYKQMKKLKVDKFIKALDCANLNSVDLDRISQQDFKNYVHGYLKTCNISITASALDKIIEIKEDDYISVLHQLPKLVIADTRDHGLDSEDIESIITGVEAHSIWDLTDAIECEDTDKYLKVLKYLFMNGISAVIIIGTLITHYNKLYMAKFLLKRRLPVSEIGQALGLHSFIMNRVISSARNFSERKLDSILDIIYKLDYNCKTSGEPSARLSLQNFAFRLKLLNR